MVHNYSLFYQQLSVSTCLTQCSTSRGGQGFRLSGNAATSLVGPGVCDTDFLLLLNGFNDLDKTQVNDRYCGGALNAGPAGGAATTVCCKELLPFDNKPKSINLNSSFQPTPRVLTLYTSRMTLRLGLKQSIPDSASILFKDYNNNAQGSSK